ncbi:helix-turn-helix transcriptional regulator [Streptomyces canus]|uniref:helix-turn-helix transcriptional regulator n=1 Tax=Streptomyces canus TaxID=58343 RepID=UPI003403A6D8
MTPQQQYGTELGRFLRARRARVTPGQAGLPTGAGLPRTPGLRREELANLAGISIDYYARLERGKETRPSPSVVDALARALLLEPDEVDHLRSLAAIAARTAPELPAAPSRTVRPGVKLLLENLRPAPAYVVSRKNDLLAANPAGLRLLAGIEEWPGKERNVARYVFLHPAARDLFVDWGSQARGCVAHLRALAGTDPEAPELTRLVGELVLRSSEFAGLWKRYDVKNRSYGKKAFHHPEVGALTLGYQSLQLEATRGHHLLAYHAEPGTPDHDAVALLDLLAQQSDSRSAPPGTASSASS